MTGDPSAIRERAREAYELHWTDSFKTVMTSAALPIGFMGVIGSAVIGFKVQTPLQAVTCLLIGLASVVSCSVVAVDLDRLRRCRVRLKELMDSEMLYEQLLEDARKERDQFRREADETRAQMTVQAQYVQTQLLKQLASNTEEGK